MATVHLDAWSRPRRRAAAAAFAVLASALALFGQPSAATVPIVFMLLALLVRAEMTIDPAADRYSVARGVVPVLWRRQGGLEDLVIVVDHQSAAWGGPFLSTFTVSIAWMDDRMPIWPLAEAPRLSVAQAIAEEFGRRMALPVVDGQRLEELRRRLGRAPFDARAHR